MFGLHGDGISTEYDPGRGGEGMLRLYLPQIQITTANLKDADIIYAGDKIPVNDKSFDIVVSLATIEHLPRNNRTSFLSELYRVAKKGFMLCASFRAPEHLAYEKGILNSGILNGTSFAYLSEYVEFGLPLPEEVSEMAKIYSAKLFYQGDFREIRPSGNKNTHYDLLIQTLNNTLTDAFWQDCKHLKSSFTQYTNRFFLTANKANYAY